MIINTSRSHSFKSCQQKEKFWNEDKLRAHREDSNLLTGGGLHKALALINAKRVQNLDQAADAAEQEFKSRLGDDWDSLLPPERKLYEAEVSALRSMVRAYGEHYLGEPYEMLAPEISFCVELPDSYHHCWYAHKLLQSLYPAVVPDWNDCNGGYSIQAPHGTATCFLPHYFAGSTDAIIQWNKVVFLQEHKTTAYDLYNGSGQSSNYINAWQLNDQATGYIYGISRSTGVRPHGVLLNCIIKPRKNASNPFYSFYREAFLRSDVLLSRFEQDIIHTANDYERVMRENIPTLNPSSCYAYNRECYYRGMCLEQRDPIPGEFLQRPPDYVELKYYSLLGLEPPVPSKEAPVEKSVPTT